MYTHIYVAKFLFCHYIDGLVQDCSIAIANTLEILQSCTQPSILYVQEITRQRGGRTYPWRQLAEHHGEINSAASE